MLQSAISSAKTKRSDGNNTRETQERKEKNQIMKSVSSFEEVEDLKLLPMFHLFHVLSCVLLPFQLFSSIVHFVSRFIPLLIPVWSHACFSSHHGFFICFVIFMFFICLRAFHFPWHFSCMFQRTTWKQMKHEKHIIYTKWLRTYSKMKGGMQKMEQWFSLDVQPVAAKDSYKVSWICRAYQERASEPTGAKKRNSTLKKKLYLPS